VLDVTRRPARLLRPGLVTPGEIESLIGPIMRPAGTSETTTAALPSPGMLTRHYAPRTPLEIIEGPAQPRLEELASQGIRVVWLVTASQFRQPSHSWTGGTFDMPDDPGEYAFLLYEVLHALDAASVDRIVVTLPPDTEEWLAVRDRLRRAAAPA
jgi:L-threonylcarbamoyladenylate synthase